MVSAFPAETRAHATLAYIYVCTEKRGPSILHARLFPFESRASIVSRGALSEREREEGVVTNNGGETF